MRSESLFVQDLRDGLTGRGQKRIPSQYLYDELGSALFDAITLLPEYGVCRAEMELLNRHAADIALLCKDAAAIIELGAGGATKARKILQAYTFRPHYYPIDVSARALQNCVNGLRDVASVHPVRDRYAGGLEQVLSRRNGTSPVLVLFLGGNLGNLEPAAAVAFLTAIRNLLLPGDWMLLGIDLVKTERRLLAAYDDAAGVTAAFNRNVLLRANREAESDFDVRLFRHQARWNACHSRVEMHLESTAPQTVTLAGGEFTVTFGHGETIWTESSHKMTEEGVCRIAAETGFREQERWKQSEWGFLQSLWRRV